MIQTFTISQGVTLRCVRDLRFKQSCLSLQFVRPMCRQEAALNALIPAILLRGCESAPDMRSITLHLDDLYGASVGALVRRVGDYQTTGLSCSFIDDRFTLEGDSVLAPMLDFLGQLLLEPVLEKGAFLPAYVDSEKRNLILTIQSQKNDKRAWAMSRMLDYMCAADSFGIHRLGQEEQAAAITPESAYAHYLTILRESPVEIFYVGSTEPAQVAALLQPLFAKIPRCPVGMTPQTPFCDGGAGDYTEAMDVAQGKLCMGFVTPVSIRDPGFVAMQVFNTVYGSGMISKLFMNIREKLSLCYDIGSGYYGSKGIVTVSAGIDCKDVALVKEQVLSQLAACQQGEISQQELTAAKESLMSQLRATHDSPGAIESYYATSALSGLGMTPAEYTAAVEAVTVEAVAEAAQTVTLHTVYFLKGVEA